MARRKSSKNSGSGCALGVIVTVIAIAVANFISENAVIFYCFLLLIGAGVIVYVAIKRAIRKQREKLLSTILGFLNLENIDNLLKPYDDHIIVKSRQALDNYDDIKYLKESDCVEDVKKMTRMKANIKKTITSFLIENEYSKRPQYAYVAKQLNYYVSLTDGYRVSIVYFTSAGNRKDDRLIRITESRIKEIEAHPEYLMTKSEYNKLLRQQAKAELEEKKHLFYDKVNSIIDYTNETKDYLIVKTRAKKLDELIQQLFDRTINSIQRIKQVDSNEWDMLDNFITGIDDQVHRLVLDDMKISQYYESDDFARIKETCNALNVSRKEFNEYIEEKAQSISKLLGTRIVRNETQNEDTYNYIRAYKKSITPFTAEVSSTVFGSAENNPIEYIIKYFYPNKNKYAEQIQILRILIEELETLREAKIIIDNYKNDYNQYIQDVPDYVLENDEDGFYSRLGLAIIDEAILNIEYKFTYTSDGGMAQRSFTVPMNEENIIELISRLESKLSMQSQTKEQRALMTTKLRLQIKERDNYTCCQCGNSIKNEPNLLLEVDHIVPIAKGGLTIENNLQTLCWKCNRSKGSKLYSA